MNDAFCWFSSIEKIIIDDLERTLMKLAYFALYSFHYFDLDTVYFAART
jgi:hypothetical protein